MELPTFKNKQLFEQAFTHRSYLNEGGRGTESNERLEFLGDSILSYIVSSYIYSKYPELKEGELTNLRAALTNTTALYVVGQKLNLGEHLMLSRGEEASGGRQNKSILANTFEAVLGAVYIDQGIEAAEKFVVDTVLADVDAIIEMGLKDAKNLLQELLQKEKKSAPSYQVTKEEGPDHAKRYTVGVYLAGELLAEGDGKSKQEAEKSAARNALTLFIK